MPLYEFQPRPFTAERFDPAAPETPSGVRKFSDDLCYHMGWPSGSYGVYYTDGARRVEKGDYLIYGAKAHPTIMPAEQFEEMFRLSAAP